MTPWKIDNIKSHYFSPSKVTFRVLMATTLLFLGLPRSLAFSKPFRLHPPRSSLFSTTSSAEVLAERILESYKVKETDGIIDFLVSEPSILTESDEDFEESLIPSILEHLDDHPKKNGILASVMNSLIGSCCYLMSSGSDMAQERLADRVENLMVAYDNLHQTDGIAPDMVTYSLAYSALQSGSSPSANVFLETAVKQAKKVAGGKRRKALAAARRRASSTFTDSEETLKDLLGSDFGVLMETEELVVINKPSGVPCYHRKTTTAGKIHNKKKKKNGNSSQQSAADVSLEDALLHCSVPLSTLNPEGLGIVHRLDRGSSGCLLLAKTDDAHARLVSEFFLRRTSKKYLTILQATSDSRLRNEGIVESSVHERPAKSRYRVLKRFDSSYLALVEFEIFTGRKHQVRVHAAKDLSSQVLDDVLYGNIDDDQSHSKSNDRSKQIFYLHASNLVIPKFDIDVTAPIPSWWQESIPELQQYEDESK